MPTNQDLLKVIGDLKGKAATDGAIKALEAIRSVDLKQDDKAALPAFVKAVMDHNAVWGIPDASDLARSKGETSLDAIKEQATIQLLRWQYEKAIGAVEAKEFVFLMPLAKADKKIKEDSERQAHQKKLSEAFNKLKLPEPKSLPEDLAKAVVQKAKDRMVEIQRTELDKVKNILRDPSYPTDKLQSNLSIDKPEQVGPWVGVPQLVEIQKEIRMQLFNRIAPGRPKLKEAFNALSAEEQHELLASKSYSTGLEFAKTLTSHAQLAKLFGPTLSTAKSQEIIQENKQFNQFKNIQNGCLANLLMNTVPPVELNDKAVDAINKLLVSTVGEDRLIKGIQAALKRPDIAVDPKLKAEIKGQRAGGNILATVCHDEEANPGLQRMLGAFLAQNITHQYHPTSIEHIDTLIKTCKSLKEFTAYLKSDNEQVRKELVAGLTDTLTETMYRDIRSTYMKHVLENEEDETLRDEVYNSIRKGATEIKVDNYTFYRIAKDIEIVVNNQVHNASFDALAKKANPFQTKQAYDTLLNESEVILAQAKRHQQSLEAYLDMLPEDSLDPIPSSDPEIKRASELRQLIEKELKKIDVTMKTYQEHQKKLRLHSEELDRLHIGNAQHYYRAFELKERIVTKTELDDLRAKFTPSASSGHVAGSVTLTNSDVPVTLKAGQSYLHEFSDEQEDAKSKVKSTIGGAFTQTYITPATDRTARAGRPSCKVEAIREPVCVDASGAKPSNATKIKFYMDMAMSLIVANGGKAPTKEHPIRIQRGTYEEVRWFWTACKLLGESKDLKFDADAIKIEGCGFMKARDAQGQERTIKFKPEDEVSGIFKKFTDQSLYSKLKNSADAKDVIEAKQQHASVLGGQHKSAEAAQKVMSSAMKEIRQDMQNTVRKEVLDKAKQAGELEGSPDKAPVGPRPI